MTARTMPPTTRAPTAVAAFLRGVQRRATLIAWLQCGDRHRADAVVAATGNGFPALVEGQAMEQWPVRYWGALVADPALRGPAPGAVWPRELAWLGGLSGGVRAVLLLRVVAGLPQSDIAAALAVPAGTVHAGLRDALPKHPDGSHDPIAWQARQAALRDALDAMPAASPAPSPQEVAAPPPRRTRLLLWAGVAACVLALAATFLPFQPLDPGDADGTATGIPLPPSQAPTVPLEPDLALLSHPDLEQLADPGDATIVRDLDFYAWYAARLSEDAQANAGGADDAR